MNHVILFVLYFGVFGFSIGMKTTFAATRDDRFADGESDSLSGSGSESSQAVNGTDVQVTTEDGYSEPEIDEPRQARGEPVKPVPEVDQPAPQTEKDEQVIHAVTEAGSKIPAPVAVTEVSGFSTEDLILVSRMLRVASQSVARHLAVDESFRHDASMAIKERKRRKRAGKALAILGATLIGASDVAGAILIVSAPGYPDVYDWDRVWIGIGVFGAGVAVGVPLLVSGVVCLTKKRKSELLLIRKYRYSIARGQSWHRTENSPPQPSVAPEFHWPVLSLSF